MIEFKQFEQYKGIFCQPPVLGLGLGVNFTFAWDFSNNNNENPQLNFFGLRERDRG